MAADERPDPPSSHRGSRAPLKVALAFLPRHSLFDELSAMTADALRSLGCRVMPVADGDPAALGSDLLLLAGNCLGFEGFASLLGTRRGRRPRVALWLTEALPPPGLTRESLDQGLRVAEGIRHLKMAPVSRFLNAIVPQRAREPIYAALHGLLAPAMTADLRRQSFALDDALRHGMMHRYLWLKRHLPQQWIDHLFVTTMAKKEFLDGVGIAAEFIPLGYHRGMGQNWSRARDVPVLFLGGLYRRRRALLDTTQGALARQAIEMTIASGGCYGQPREALLNRARVSLNLLSFPWELPGVRLLLSMGCGALVVSEPQVLPAPYRPGVHFVEAAPRDLPDVISRYLEREGDRAEIARSAEAFVTTELTLARQVGRLLDEVYRDSGPVSVSA